MGNNIAIDGPSGAGKSTIAKETAKRLNYIYIDTGAMYRAMAYYFLSNHIASTDEEKIAESCGQIDISITYIEGEQQVLLNGKNISSYIRTEEVGKMASATSGYACVRSKLVELQRQLAKREDVIMDGRDIGTCVLPDAKLKIYLTASIEARSQRRYQELLEKGNACELNEIMEDMMMRDERDMTRENSPLKQAQDAVLIDSSEMTIEEVIQKIIELSGVKFT